MSKEKNLTKKGTIFKDAMILFVIENAGKMLVSSYITIVLVVSFEITFIKLKALPIPKGIKKRTHGTNQST